MDKFTIVVLGNGFDLANNLQTSYNDFFENRLLETQLDKKFRWSDRENQIKNYGDFIDLANTTNYREHNFWDLYFYFKHKCNRICNFLWSNIEEEIKKVVAKDTESDFFKISMLSHLEFNDRDRIFNYSTEKIPLESQLHRKYLYYFLINKHSINREEDVYDALQSELFEFETNFKMYIYDIMKELRYGQRKQQYRNSFLRLLPNNGNKEVYLINFNYTKIESVELKEPKEKVQIKRNENEYSITEVNIHGESEKVIIFGIDQSKIKVSEQAYNFTKTYRKMQNQKSVKSAPLPDHNNVTEIVFYGHSLAEADYSYFQSLFDFYDLYHGKVCLTFLYSHYDIERKKEIDNAQLKSITELLARYGETMDNKDHGHNLTHKLLLENRLTIKILDTK